MSRVIVIGLMLLAGLATRMDASFLFAGGQCTGRGTLQGQSDFKQTSVPGQFATATLGDQCASSASATYSTFKLGTTAGGFAYPPQATWIEGSAWAEVQIWFGLIDPSRPANSPGTIYLPVNYDVTLTSGANQFAGVGSRADFGIQDPSNPFSPVLYLNSGQPDGSRCPSPLPTFPACNGRYQGTVQYAINVNYNTGNAGNRVYLRFDVSGLDGSSNALNTVTFGNILLPTGADYSYDSNIGNPLGFTTATSTGVPEPGTVCMLAAGLLGMGALRRRCCS